MFLDMQTKTASHSSKHTHHIQTTPHSDTHTHTHTNPHIDRYSHSQNQNRSSFSLTHPHTNTHTHTHTQSERRYTNEQTNTLRETLTKDHSLMLSYDDVVCENLLSVT